MSIVRRIFPSDTDAHRPRLAIEIMPYGVLAAAPGDIAVAGESQDVRTAYVPLRVGAATPGLKLTNLPDRAAVSAAIRQALGQVYSGKGSRQVTVIVPDAAVRVLLLDFDTLPPKAADVLPILRFRLKKLVPFEVEDAAVTYQVMQKAKLSGNGTDNLVRTAVAVMPNAIRAEYEDAVREAGFEPGAFLSSSLASLAALPHDRACLLVNRNANSVTTAISHESELLLFRTLDFAESSIDPIAESVAIEELQSAVSVSMAYYEDSLKEPLPHIFSVGPGGAAELERLLADPSIRVRELVPSPPGAAHAETTGMLAGVVGALAS